MRPEGDPSLNVFVRFKQHVDSNVSSGIHTLLGLPRSSSSSSSSPPPLTPTPDQAGLTDTQTSNSTPPTSNRNFNNYSRPCDIKMDSIGANPFALDAFSLATWSYAPSNLRHLRQPVPNDLPSQHDSKIFTFEDALEDLLAVSQGHQLPDINTKYSQRQLLRQMFPSGEPTWFWLRRLKSQGLLARPGRDGLGGLENLAFGRQIEGEFSRPQWPVPVSDRLHQELHRRMTEVWRAAAAAAAAGTNETDDRRSTGDFFDEIHKGFKKMEDRFNGRGDGPQQSGFPDHFDDLFSAISSSFAGGQKTWDTFTKTIPGNKPIFADNNTNPSSDINDDGSREAVSRDEYVDSFGYVHTTVTRKIFDKDGNRVGSETHITLRPADRKRRDDKAGEQHNEDDIVIDRIDSYADDQQARDKKTTGWFWK